MRERWSMGAVGFSGGCVRRSGARSAKKPQGNLKRDSIVWMRPNRPDGHAEFGSVGVGIADRTFGGCDHSFSQQNMDVVDVQLQIT